MTGMKTQDGYVIIPMTQLGIRGWFEGIEIATPEDAHNFRAAVNKAVDLFMGNHKKIGK